MHMYIRALYTSRFLILSYYNKHLNCPLNLLLFIYSPWKVIYVSDFSGILLLTYKRMLDFNVENMSCQNSCTDCAE